MRNHTNQAGASAKRLRRTMSLPEVLLWRELRARRDVKLRKQHPLGRYVVDFYCDAVRTIFEIDGIVHAMGDRGLRDEARDLALSQAGYRIVRIPAADVLHDVASAADSIYRMCLAPPPPSDAARLPPPPMVEDLR